MPISWLSVEINLPRVRLFLEWPGGGLTTPDRCYLGLKLMKSHDVEGRRKTVEYLEGHDRKCCTILFGSPSPKGRSRSTVVPSSKKHQPPCSIRNVNTYCTLQAKKNKLGGQQGSVFSSCVCSHRLQLSLSDFTSPFIPARQNPLTCAPQVVCCSLKYFARHAVPLCLILFSSVDRPARVWCT